MNNKKQMNMIICNIILSVVCIVMSFIAGYNYRKGYNSGYKDACNNHLDYMDSVVAKYVEATAKYDESKYWCDKVRDLYQAKLDSLNSDNHKK